MAKMTNITRDSALKATAANEVNTAASKGLADQALIDLGAEFETAWAAEEASLPVGECNDDAWASWEAASGVTGRVVAQIEQLDAASLEGLRIQARCLLWASGDRTLPFRGETSDMRLSRKIVASLLAA